MRQLIWLLVGFVILLVLTFFILSSLHNPALSRPGYWTTSGDPEIDKWFSDQKIPGSRQKCCSTADGKFVEEDIREGHYWARWEETKGQWIPVPDEAVINEPNKWGMPAVWWGFDDDSDEIYIKCYAPGAKG